MTDELQRVDPDANEPKYLLDRPQRLGILPSYWFWNRPENFQHIRWPQAILAGLLAFVWLVVRPTGLSIWLSALVPSVAIVLALGLFERYLRRRAIACRHITDLELSEAAPSIEAASSEAPAERKTPQTGEPRLR